MRILPTQPLPTQPRPTVSVRPRRLPGRRVAAALLGLAVALGACSDLTLPRSDAPEELEFSIGGFAGTSHTVELRGDTVVLWRAAWDQAPGTPAESVRTVPTPAAWSEFWSAARRSGVTRWRPKYMAEGVVDGAGWGLRLVVDGQVIESEGSNAYPDRRGFEHELERTRDFQAFIDALGELIGEPLERSGPDA